MVDEICIVDWGFGLCFECICLFVFGEVDYIVWVYWWGLCWLIVEGMCFDMMGFLCGLDCGKNGEIIVMIGNLGNKKVGVFFLACFIVVLFFFEKVLISKIWLFSENCWKGWVV